MCYTDSLNTLRLIESAQEQFHVHANEVALVRNLLAHAWEVKLQHVYREANFCADYFAKLGMSVPTAMVHVVSPPVALARLL